MGGDMLAGTNFVDALKIFENDPDTGGIILVGEVGGTAELDAAEWIADYNRRCANPKPIMALVAGMQAPRGRVMGHAGAWAAPGEPDARKKYKALESAGAVMVHHPENFGEKMKGLLSKNTSRFGTTSTSTPLSHRRGFHTRRQLSPTSYHRRLSLTQVRTLYVTQFQALDMLKEKSIPVNEMTASPDDISISVTIDRTALSPCVIASPSPNPDEGSYARKFPFDYASASVKEAPFINAIVSHLHLSGTSQAHAALASLIDSVWQIFKEKEAFLLETRVNVSPEGKLEVRGARFGFDDAAFRSSGRHGDVHRLRDKAEEVWEEVEAEKDGIVYVKLAGGGSIGTLVNGAGLAMNTVDALTLHGGHCANFLDTGGKATSETVKSSFRIISSDARVKAIFVNIFGGLTRCDMIAEGIIMAFRDLGMEVPVVVRLRGTNEEIGQKMIADSGLRLHAFDSFENAAKKVVSLAGGA
ncbi:hypothetical protein MPDQ_004016 [Monascus purpureus]|uniref:ATP-citrate synthase/succinyl-CoA ligase C-terminal domain-containing protein n=1 Tax=Monascus purpureus TaxID=5098 RepID=A0A507QKF5_MONPU|nr:hypothetical protein MPDQ_004016 [Monascus purpureus]